MLSEAKDFTPHPIKLFIGDTFIEFPSMGNCRAVGRQGCARTEDVKSGRSYRMHFWDTPTTGVGALPTDPPVSIDQRGHAAGELLTPVLRPMLYEGVEWIPHEPDKGDSVIVSIIAAPAVAESRPDLTVYVPDTGPRSAVRDANGRIEGVTRMILWHDPEDDYGVSVAVPLNPANPEGDGHEVIRRFPATAAGFLAAVEEAKGKPELMVVPPNGYPWFPPADATDRDARKAWRARA